MKIIQPLRDIGTPLVDISGPIPFVGVQAAFDEFFQRGTLRSYWKSTYVEELTDPILDIIVDKARNRPSERTFVIAFLMGGAINRVGAEDTAYSERSANWMVSIDGNWEDAGDDDKVISWVRGAWGEVHEHGTGSLYLNFTSVADEAVTVGVESAFGKTNLQRLQEIKAQYDPDNFFRLNNNISPAWGLRQPPSARAGVGATAPRRGADRQGPRSAAPPNSIARLGQPGSPTGSGSGHGQCGVPPWERSFRCGCLASWRQFGVCLSRASGCPGGAAAAAGGAATGGERRAVGRLSIPLDGVHLAERHVVAAGAARATSTRWLNSLLRCRHSTARAVLTFSLVNALDR